MENGGDTIKKMNNKTYCVTGATGYVGSWLVNALLQNGYKVHATVRDLDKASYLLSKWKNEDRLKLFKADLQDEGSFDEVVKGCDGVFHVAASMQFNVQEQDNIENYVQSNIIDPAIKGMLNLLRACKRSNSVKRVVLTSSMSTITAKDKSGNWIPVVDETCLISTDDVWNTRASGWVYALTKLLTEEAAYNFAKENDLDLVSVTTTTVAGPFLTSTVPPSIQVHLSPITGDPELISFLKDVNAIVGSIGLVHVEDLCNAHLLLMEHPNADGRYLCCAQTCHLSQFVQLLAHAYPTSSTINNWINTENDEGVPSVISSKKLQDSGFEYKHDMITTINHFIKDCMECGYLTPIE